MELFGIRLGGRKDYEMSKLIMFVFGLAILFVLVAGIGGWAMDVSDGGNAQVIRVEPPPLSLTPEYDLAYSEVYQGYAKGNKTNAEADAITTTANSGAVRDIGGMIAGILGAVAVVFIGLGFVVKMGGG